MRTVDDILADLQAIVDGSDGRSLTDDEVTRYEALETELAGAQRSNQVRARNAAYNAPVAGQHLAYAGVAKPDDTLDKAFNAYLRTGVGNADITGLRVRNAQQEGGSAAGGYLVPTTMRQKIVEVMKAYGGVASVAESFTTGNGAPVEYPSVDDTANSGEIVDEGSAPSTGADVVFGSVELGAYRYGTAGAGANPIRLSMDLLQDSAFDVEGLLSRLIGRRLARAEAAHLATGTGVKQPLGLFTPYRSTTYDNDLATPDTVVYQDLLDTEDLLDPDYEGDAKWLMRKNTWSKIRAILDGNSRPIVQDSISGIGGRPPKMLLGYPVEIDQGAPTLSSAGITNPIAFGDFRQAYVVRRVTGPVVTANPYSRMGNGEVEYFGWERIDGNVQNRSAYVLVRNNT